jgi:hypothetical protein
MVVIKHVLQRHCETGLVVKSKLEKVDLCTHFYGETNSNHKNDKPWFAFLNENIHKHSKILTVLDLFLGTGNKLDI